MSSSNHSDPELLRALAALNTSSHPPPSQYLTIVTKATDLQTVAKEGSILSSRKIIDEDLSHYLFARGYFNDNNIQTSQLSFCRNASDETPTLTPFLQAFIKTGKVSCLNLREAIHKTAVEVSTKRLITALEPQPDKKSVFTQDWVDAITKSLSAAIHVLHTRDNLDQPILKVRGFSKRHRFASTIKDVTQPLVGSNYITDWDPSTQSGQEMITHFDGIIPKELYPPSAKVSGCPRSAVLLRPLIQGSLDLPEDIKPISEDAQSSKRQNFSVSLGCPMAFCENVSSSSLSPREEVALSFARDEDTGWAWKRYELFQKEMGFIDMSLAMKDTEYRQKTELNIGWKMAQALHECLTESEVEGRPDDMPALCVVPESMRKQSQDPGKSIQVQSEWVYQHPKANRTRARPASRKSAPSMTGSDAEASGA